MEKMYDLSLTRAEVELIANALSAGAYRSVAPLLAKIGEIVTKADNDNSSLEKDA